MTGREKYIAYLNSFDWQQIREHVRKRDDYKCVKCGSRGLLECHHTSYKFLYREWANDYKDLISLCRKCHQKEHDKAEQEKNNVSLSELYEKVRKFGL